MQRRPTNGNSPAPARARLLPNLTRRLSGVDSAFLYLERKEIPLHIAGVCVFDGPIPFAEFVKTIDSKLHLLPRYRQVVVDPQFHHRVSHVGGRPELRHPPPHLSRARWNPPGVRRNWRRSPAGF